MARVPYVTREELPAEYRALFDTDPDDPEDVIVNVHRAWANNPRLLAAWVEWGTTVYEEVGDARLRELVLLAVARTLECRYVWHQHVPIAFESRVERREVRAVANGEYGGFEPRETAAVEYATALVTGEVDDATHEALASHVDDGTVVALAYLASEYEQIATLIDGLDVELAEPFVGWDLSQLA